MALPPILVELKAVSGEFMAKMAEARAEMGHLGTSGSASMLKLQQVGKVATLGLIAGTVAVGVESLKMAGHFEASTNVLVTAAGESAAGLKVVRKGILDIASSTGSTWENLTEGMYQVEKAGYRGADGLAVLKAAAQGAREENASLESVTNAMTSVMASYHLKATDSVRVMNALKTAAGEGKMTMEEFSSSLSTVLPIASANHISFGQVGGALATLTQHGTSAAEATQELSATIRALAAPNRVAQAEMQQLGLDANDVSKNLGKRGLTGTVALLTNAIAKHMGPAGMVVLDVFKKSSAASGDLTKMLAAMDPKTRKLAESFRDGHITSKQWSSSVGGLTGAQADLAHQYGVIYNKAHGFNDLLKKGDPAAQTFSDALKRMSGGAIGLNTVLQLSGENTKGFQERVDKVSTSFNHASKNVEGWDSTNKLFDVQMAKLKQTIEAAAITIGMRLIPVVQTAASWFAKHKDVVVALISIIGGALAISIVAYIAHLVVLIATTVAHTVAVTVGTARMAARIAIIYAAKAAEMAANVATKAWTAGQWLLNAALTANPIGLVIVAIVALAAGIIYAYKHSETFRNVVNAALHAVAVAVKYLGGQFTGAFDEIKAAFHWATSTFPNALVQAGKDLIHGLVAGIKAMAMAPVNAIKDVGKGVIGAAKGIFHINSPSKVFHDIGAGVMEGLNDGIVANAGAPVKAARDAATKLIMAFKAKVVADKAGELAARRHAEALGNQAHEALRAAEAMGTGTKAARAAKDAAMQHARALADLARTSRQTATHMAQDDRVKEAAARSAAAAATKAAEVAKVAALASLKVAQTAAEDAVDAVHKSLEAMTHDLDKLKGERDSFLSSMADSISGGTTLVDAWKQQGTDGGTATVAGLQAALDSQLASSSRFATDLRELVNEGASQGLITELSKGGTDAGLAMADSLLAAGPAAVVSLSSVLGQIKQVGLEAGADIAASYYQPGIDAMTNLIAGMQSKESELQAQVERIKALMESISSGTTSPAAVIAKTPNPTTPPPVTASQTMAQKIAATPEYQWTTAMRNYADKNGLGGTSPTAASAPVTDGLARVEAAVVRLGDRIITNTRTA